MLKELSRQNAERADDWDNDYVRELSWLSLIVYNKLLAEGKNIAKLIE
jgi:hypothetical protein